MEPAGPPAAPARVVLRRLAVRDFRNLQRVELAVPPDGLTVVGENGHGKTNLLESVYYLELLRSVRGARDADLVRFGAPGFHVAAEVDLPGEHRVASRAVGVGFERAGKRKRVRIDGAEVPRLSDALGALPSVIFSPGDVVLVAGSPSERRRYLDVALALTSRRYLAALQAYRGALVRRNAALRDAARTGRGEERATVWEPALAEHGAVLWTERRAWVRRHAGAFAALCAAIGERAPMRLRYATALEVDGEDSVEGARAALGAALAAKRPLDLRRGLTHAGPHRDDLDLALGGRELRLFGSAGQQRTAAIALRMLEAATLRDHVGSAPLFLLDDPFAELDARRAHAILALLGDAGLGQVLLVVPRASDVPEELTRLPRASIRDGVLDA
ncbi:DNA replication and repair protein RecF [Roseisolibacter sp. H3M3-2]|uniref:DNA replication/repair protein RecF n=1 Tax=Roseisolibacter sp. H3M3-2 TaxID=3031323 RepID=UPI0023DA1B15|nr:DNA replication and repair protein RecF [Roseisolibacter sp. H3M3-2]MDF1503910.1 DNA replication and repair protein RecF [Roseisolibacter sp. H3M3-2]